MSGFALAHQKEQSVNGSTSHPVLLKFGVPQGSGLGFVCFIHIATLRFFLPSRSHTICLLMIVKRIKNN